MNDLSEYQGFAIQTLAPSEDVEHDVLHCILGMVGEMGELYDTISSGEGFIGEVGDCMWYAANMSNLLGVEFHTLFEGDRVDHYQMGLLDLVMYGGRVAGRMAEDIKKVLFYKMPLNNQAMLEHLSLYVSVLRDLVKVTGVTPLDAAETNIRKLSKRYHGLKFTTEAAIKRDYDAESKAAGTTII